MKTDQEFLADGGETGAFGTERSGTWAYLARWNPYVLTGVALFLATGARASLTPLWGSGYTFIAYYPAIMFGAWIGGWRVGLAATAVSAVLSVAFFLPIAHLDAQQGMALAFFVAANLIVTLLAEGLHRARGDAEAASQAKDESIADRKRAEELARQRAAQFEALFDAAPLGVYLVGADFLIRQVNPVARPVFGDMPDLVGRDFDEVIHTLWPKPYADEVVQRFRHTLETGEPYVVPEGSEERLDRGVSEYYEWQIHRIPLPEGRYGVVCYFRDISRQVLARAERRSAEEALRENEERYRTLFASAPMAVFVCDREAVIQQYNRRAVELWGREPAKGVERHCGSVRLWLANGTLLPHAQSPIVEVLRTGVPASNVEVFIERPDGSRLPVLVNFAALKDPQGNITGAITSFMDITERKQAEAALRQAGERFRFLAESMPQKIFTAKPDGDVDYFNPQWSEFTGLTFEQIRDWGWTQFIHPDDVVENIRVWRQSIGTGAPFQFEHRFRRADGEYRWHFSRALPMRDANGRIVMWIGSNTDIHDLKTAQETLKEADRRKDEFLATLSHELRNPLAPIRNAVQLLREADDDAQIRAQARDILERQVGHTIRLVDDLLDHSRITLGTITLERQPVELGEIIDSAVEISRPHINAAGHRLETRIAEPSLMLSADRVRLAQVMANVLNNAAKYTPRGGLITLEARGEDGAAVVSIRDNGAGIPSRMLQRVFDTFARVDADLHRVGGGLGIGLSLSKKLVEMHGGSIEARSEGPGRGSEFVVRVPLVVSSQPLPMRAKDAPGNVAQSPRRVLVVDDNVDAAQSLGVLLKLMGHEVRLAHDGRAALEAADRDPPEIILLDIGLPKIDGYGVAEQLRKDSRFQRVRFVSLTGYGQEDDRKRSREAGFDEHVVKPIDFAMLRGVLERTRSP